MDLTWWPVALAGFGCLASAIALAMLLPMEQVRRQLRPLANTRLTRLPEYAPLARTRVIVDVITWRCWCSLFGEAVLASARPTGWSWEHRRPTCRRTSCCVSASRSPSQATADFLTYFAATGAEPIGTHASA